MTRIAILGSTGMLGSTLTHVLRRDFGPLTELNRTGTSVVDDSNVVVLDVAKAFDLYECFEGLRIDFVINAIGMIRQVIDEKNPNDLALANLINSEFPKKLNEFSLKTGTRIIQIGTDCVFSGSEGGYSEEDSFNPTDVYGQTKNLGERASTESMIIRCSIIGKELTGNVSLMGWVLSQRRGAVINGFTNHLWNGLTTLHFSEIVSGVIKSKSFSKGVFHLVPRNTVSKYELIRYIANVFGRSDLKIKEFTAEKSVDRSLITLNPSLNLQMWKAGGYTDLQSIEEMVSRYAKWSQGK